MKRILVVDDEAGVREIIQASLKAVAGWDVFTAASGQEGIAIAKTEQLDLILLDLMMPGEDGIATTKRLKADPLTQTIPTIFLTAKANLIKPQIITELGIAGVIRKPFQAQALVQQIKQILAW